MTAPSPHTGQASHHPAGHPAGATLLMAPMPISAAITPVSGVTLKGSVR
ncbi:hypothetical protein [Pelodictyon luteolum]|nr:hypothetical protein [Pelodictyon luteolum]